MIAKYSLLANEEESIYGHHNMVQSQRGR
jgi:hypothetical protein